VKRLPAGRLRKTNSGRVIREKTNRKRMNHRWPKVKFPYHLNKPGESAGKTEKVAGLPF
jgi:hypothetical protein